MMRLFTLVLLLSFMSNHIHGQTNLVPNPSFEAFNTCPVLLGQLNNATSWTNPSPLSNPDFFHACSGVNNQLTPPVNGHIADLLPRTGSGMVGLIAYNGPFSYQTNNQITRVFGNFHEYISCKLSCKMVAGQTYTVSYWTARGAFSGGLSSSHMGVHFSTTPPSVIPAIVSADTIIDTPTMLNAVPQLEEQTIVSDTAWTQFTYTITATAAWEYMTIGSFRTVSQMSVVPSPAPPLKQAYYFFDDVSVLAPPINPVTTFTPPTCFGATNGSASATVPIPGVAFSYSWAPGGSTSNTIGPIGAGDYTVTASDGACGSGSVVVHIPAPTPLGLQIQSVPTRPCPGAPFTLTADVLNGTAPYTINWSNGATNTSSLSLIAGQSDPTYSCTATDANGCQALPATHTVVLAPVPLASFSYTQIPTGTTVLFTNTTDGAVKSFWNISDGTPLPEPWEGVYMFATDGDYTVSLYVQNALGCKDSVSQLVRVLPQLALYVPNAFTPNGDNTNDVFAAKGTSVGQFEMTIFDRLGNTVFSSKDMATGWDGTCRNQLLTNDVYVWHIHVKDVFGNDYKRAGSVTLVR